MSYDESKKAWDRFESDIQGLAGELKRHYRDAGDDKSSPRRTVTAPPASFTRSPAIVRCSVPPRADAWRATSSRRRSFVPHHGPSVQCAEPVTGSSSMPDAGAKKRDTMSNAGSLERLVIMTPGDRVEIRHLPAPLLPPTVTTGEAPAAARGPLEDFPSLAAAREDFEKRYIWKKYQECGGNMSRTSEALRVERSNLYRKMKGYGLLPARKGEVTETA